ncbi:hypothetical protein TRICI_003207 [Trichomonascus ciferrii]|uniref:Uncharacterized protein n=1 Tax=Trichomonascus ciferrii TaxID=44093 RepID=A0A642V4G3_9ASCO|nr:hypothetical protein TRICI_003207 [Trichomonascus ciferrii]
MLTLISYENGLRCLITTCFASKAECRQITYVVLGCTFVMEIDSLITKGNDTLATIEQPDNLTTDATSGFPSQYIWKTRFKGDRLLRCPDVSLDEQDTAKKELEMLTSDRSLGRGMASFNEVRTFCLRKLHYYMMKADRRDVTLMVVQIPLKFFAGTSIQLRASLWLWTTNVLSSLK